ncbi:hypothetical protein HUU05_09165 [candidate division KSB1 bacterium]|nr:hypothetical protein [candidate division KSB1 bacterium]
MKRTMAGMLRWSFIPAMMALVLYGCNDSAMQPTAGSISLSLQYSANSPRTALSKNSADAFAAAVDSLQLTRVRVVLSKIELESANDSADFRTTPMVLDLDLSGAMQTLGIMGVPFGTYSEVEFKIHRVDSTDLTVVSPDEQARFADFLLYPRASIIVEGIAYTNGCGQAFAFRSGLEAEQEYELTPPLVVSDANPTANITISINSSNWFRDRNGALLDPADFNNQDQISGNLKASFKVYEDDDRDGGDDDDHGGDDDDDGGDGDD